MLMVSVYTSGDHIHFYSSCLVLSFLHPAQGITYTSTALVLSCLPYTRLRGSHTLLQLLSCPVFPTPGSGDHIHFYSSCLLLSYLHPAQGITYTATALVLSCLPYTRLRGSHTLLQLLSCPVFPTPGSGDHIHFYSSCLVLSFLHPAQGITYTSTALVLSCLPYTRLRGSHTLLQLLSSPVLPTPGSGDHIHFYSSCLLLSYLHPAQGITYTATALVLSCLSYTRLRGSHIHFYSSCLVLSFLHPAQGITYTSTALVLSCLSYTSGDHIHCYSSCLVLSFLHPAQGITYTSTALVLSCLSYTSGGSHTLKQRV
ncbi:hypothetical protein BaRGS_00030953 [Batillaria attramentaria]|uniref:Uncharacterized protein n=1 Tax=Batillaria attramentaria TaxID=370345 RepID=A0ABD0JRR7_9CAEN